MIKTTSLDFSDPLIQANPYPHYAHLRQEMPVCWNGRSWLISRYDDIVTLLNDPRMSSARTEQTFAVLPPDVQEELTPLRTILGSRMLLSDPPQHTRLKAIVAKAFTPRMIEGRRARIEQICHGFIDEASDSGTMDVAVSEDNLAQAIGRSGQNVRLASELTGWTINVMSKEEAADKHEAEAGQVIQLFMDQLDIDEDVAEILVEEGFTTLEEVAYVPLQEMTAIEGFDADIAEELRARAKDALLTQAIASEEQLGAREPAEDLLTMDGMDRHLAYILASREIVTMEDLAEQGVDDLMDIPDMTEERAGALIMTARAPWFAEAE